MLYFSCAEIGIMGAPSAMVPKEIDRNTKIFFVIYSHTTSMLYFSCADIGIIGAPSAMVPEKYTEEIWNRWGIFTLDQGNMSVK